MDPRILLSILSSLSHLTLGMELDKTRSFPVPYHSYVLSLAYDCEIKPLWRPGNEALHGDLGMRPCLETWE